jgi:hypothetical protein
MLSQNETARQWHGERLLKCDRLGGVINSEVSSTALQIQRLVGRFGLAPELAAVVALHVFGRAS